MPSLEQAVLACPITALEFVRNNLLSGEGSDLHIFDVSQKVESSQKRVFKAATIHGIRSYLLNEDYNHILAVFGSKSIRILDLHTESRIEFRTLEVEFEDWIWDVCWLEQEDADASNCKPQILGLTLGHNTVICWDYTNNQILQRVHCEEKCILYCSKFIGSKWKNLVLAAGTVFNQVVVWAPASVCTNGDRVMVMHRLTGHQGVIFSLAYNACRSYICSVSDDRSLRLWYVRTLTGDRPLSRIDWESAQFDLLHVLYGHTARVWDARILSNYIVSVGEDATCCIWNNEGHVIHKYKGHKGKSIWSLAVNSEQTTIATGGGDCSIRLWPVKPQSDISDQPTTQYLQPPLEKDDFPRIVQLSGVDTVLLMTNQGRLLAYDIVEQTWEEWMDDSRYSSYSVLVPSPAGSLVAIGNITGWIRIHVTKDLWLEDHICDGKVHNIIWLEDQLSTGHTLLTSGTAGTLILWQLLGSEDVPRLQLLKQFVLPYTKQRWVSAAVLLPQHSLLLCGDRGGSVHSFSLGRQLQEPVQSLWKIHGKAGVTCICGHDNQVYTAGRDGHYRVYDVIDEKLDMLSSNRVLKGLDWIVRLMFMQDQMLVLGFYTDTFIVYDSSVNQRLLCVACGGGHRAWDFSLTTLGSAHFVCIKATNIMLCTTEIVKGQTVLKPSLHGREITSIQHICSCINNETSADTLYIIATASEDTTVSIIGYHSSSHMEIRAHKSKLLAQLNCFVNVYIGLATRPVEDTGSDCLANYQVFCRIPGHISNVRALAVSDCGCHRDTTSSKLLFSAGGRAEIKAWRINITANASCVIRDRNSDSVVAPVVSERSSEQVMCTKVRHQLLATHMLGQKRYHSKTPWRDSARDPSPETRFMALTAFPVSQIIDHMTNLHILAAACSDGFIRLFGFDEEEKKFILLAYSDYHQHCVLTVEHFIQTLHDHNHILIFTGATDGVVAIWDITNVVLHFIQMTRDGKIPSEPELAANQSSGDIERKLLQSDIDINSQTRTDFNTKHDTVVQPPNAAQITNINLKHQQSQLDETRRTANKYAILDESGTDVAKTSSTASSKLGMKNNQEKELCQMQLMYSINAHQSGVNALSVRTCTDSKFLMGTGGDDNSLSLYLLHFTLSTDMTRKHLLSVKEHVKCDTAHSAQITGLSILEDDTILSTSIDQRLSMWKVQYQPRLEVTLIESKFCNVADIHGMQIWPSTEGSYQAVVCGFGLQSWTVNLKATKESADMNR